MASKFRIVLITLAHLLLGAGIVLGYQTVASILGEILSSVYKNATSVSYFVVTMYERIYALDNYILYGIVLSSTLVVYDIKLILGWFNSFHFITKRTCKNCRINLLRQERTLGDRLLSFVVPVKRYYCIGCGKGYLRIEKQKQAPVGLPDSATAVRVVHNHHHSH